MKRDLLQVYSQGMPLTSLFLRRYFVRSSEALVLAEDSSICVSSFNVVCFGVTSFATERNKSDIR